MNEKVNQAKVFFINLYLNINIVIIIFVKKKKRNRKYFNCVKLMNAFILFELYYCVNVIINHKI